MKYKKFVRSPHYGKLFGYDEKGRQVIEYDVLKIRVISDGGKEYTLGDLFDKILSNEADNRESRKIAEGNSKELEQVNRVLETAKEERVLLRDAVKAISKKMNSNKI